MPTVPIRAPRRLMAGFTLTELLIASTAFVVILTAAVSLLVQWQKLTASSDSDLAAIEDNTRAIGTIADDVRVSTYLYQLATVSITDNSGKHYFGDTAYTFQIPIVTQAINADLPAGLDQTAYFRRGGMTRNTTMQVNGDSLMGITSQGSIPVLALISDQPYGISKPRYIVYFVGGAVRRGQLRSTTDRVDAGDPTLYVHPLYRLEASPSVTYTAPQSSTPTSWYTFHDAPSAIATSALQITLNAGGTATLANPYGNPASIPLSYRFNRVAWLVLEDVTSTTTTIKYPFTLRNPHPYSNAGLISPYLVNIDLRVSRVGTASILHRGDSELYELNTNAFARNVPLPQLPGS